MKMYDLYKKKVTLFIHDVLPVNPLNRQVIFIQNQDLFIMLCNRQL